MTALKQALNSARPRGGVIDEGNSIYLFDIGVTYHTHRQRYSTILRLRMR